MPSEDELEWADMLEDGEDREPREESDDKESDMSGLAWVFKQGHLASQIPYVKCGTTFAEHGSP